MCAVVWPSRSSRHGPRSSRHRGARLGRSTLQNPMCCTPVGPAGEGPIGPTASKVLNTAGLRGRRRPAVKCTRKTPTAATQHTTNNGTQIHHHHAGYAEIRRGSPCAVWVEGSAHVVRPNQPGSRSLPRAVTRPSTKTDCREALGTSLPGRSLARVLGRSTFMRDPTPWTRRLHGECAAISASGLPIRRTSPMA